MHDPFDILTKIHFRLSLQLREVDAVRSGRVGYGHLMRRQLTTAGIITQAVFNARLND